jgi:LysM repeat protein
MKFKKLLISGIISASITISAAGASFAQPITYTVQPGDTFWKISEKFHVSIHELMAVNNANQYTVIYIGQKLIIPSGSAQEKIYSVQKGDTFWIISQKYNVDIHALMSANNANQNTILYIGQKIKIPSSGGSNTPTAPGSSGPYITYKNYTVKSGDYFWAIALKFGITLQELLKANNMTESTVLKAGDVLKIPVHNVPVKQTPGEKYGEYLDWWTEAQYVIPVGSVFEVVDFYTGKSFMAKRTTGANHADVETLTLSDTNKMKEIWGGAFSWVRRPVIIKFNGRKIAASAASMPHGGNDGAAGGVYTSWRSGGYGAGYNLDWVKGNGIDGVFDIHFANSTRHSNGTVDEEHQKNIRISAGI